MRVFPVLVQSRMGKRRRSQQPSRASRTTKPEESRASMWCTPSHTRTANYFCFFKLLLWAVKRISSETQRNQSLKLRSPYYSALPLNMTNTDKPSWKNFKVAVLTAGDMRSFAFTARSWERYLLEPWAENVHLFAFVSAQPHCPLDDKGIDKLRDLATSYETIHKVKKGNVFDMYERRYRAYRLAIQYSEEKAFQWDLFLFTRTDIAYYSPII
eukprot:scaffold323_cov181-Ochromonas_danica.AAC.11